MYRRDLIFILQKLTLNVDLHVAKFINFHEWTAEIFSGSNQLICLQNVFSTLMRLARDFE